MNEVKVPLTREEIQDLWSACFIASNEAERNNLPYTAKDLRKLKEKLWKILLNQKKKQKL